MRHTKQIFRSLLICRVFVNREHFGFWGQRRFTSRGAADPAALRRQLTFYYDGTPPFTCRGMLWCDSKWHYLCPWLHFSEGGLDGGTQRAAGCGGFVIWCHVSWKLLKLHPQSTHTNNNPSKMGKDHCAPPSTTADSSWKHEIFFLSPLVPINTFLKSMHF